MSREQPQPVGSARVVDLSNDSARAHVRLPPRPTNLEDASIASRIWTLAEGRWVIAGIAAAAIGLALLYLLVATPIYRSVAVLQVESNQKSLAGLEELTQMFSDRGPAETEIEIIRSRSLMKGVVQDLGLDLQVRPRYFPLVGAAFARHHTSALAGAPMGLSRYAWGGERIAVTRLDVSADLLDRQLVLKALDGDRYELSDADGTFRLQGVVGKVAALNAKDAQPHVEVFVSELRARPGEEFLVRKLVPADVVDRYVEDLKVAERGKSTGILVMTLDGPDPARTAAIVNAVARSYVRQNVERKSAEAAKTLEFLESQMPMLKSTLDSAQSALKSFQVEKGSVDLTSETSKVLDRSVEIDKALQEIEMQRAELRQRFTENHPALASLNEKAQQLRAERASINARMRQIPATEADSARLLRDVKSASELYTMLLNKAQELRVVKSGTVGNVRIIDDATQPRKPQFPNPRLVLLIASVLGLFGGVAFVFMRSAMDQTTDDPDEIEAGTGLPVYATIPHTTAQGASGGGRPKLLAAADPGDIAVENLRSLRTSLKFALVEARNNVVTVTGPSVGVGKSFVCANLAHVIAAPDQRVLLVDCDLRRGHLHRQLGADRKPGVSEVISGQVDIASAIHTTENPHLDILPTGRIPPNPAELLGSRAFGELLDWTARHYGLVIVDTPPVLAVTDATVVSRLAGVNLLVLRAGAHSLREITLAARRFAHAGVHLHGVVLNDVQTARGRYGKYGRYQRYEYRSSPTSD